ncbi:uncharacterized protein LOC135846681 [Planococcus citri]|uniref:uncharacterized protein LOC135846681 n=1 Tax=Planococcus citri TaxID=170843 RepID=UPI0031F914B2
MRSQEYWSQLMRDAGIGDDCIEEYAAMFVEQRIRYFQIFKLVYTDFKLIGMKRVGDIVRLRQYIIRDLNEARRISYTRELCARISSTDLSPSESVPVSVDANMKSQEYWSQFMRDAGIGDDCTEEYAAMFVEQRIRYFQIFKLVYKDFKLIGMKRVGDIVRLRQYIRELNEAKRKSYDRELCARISSTEQSLSESVPGCYQ